MQPSGDSVHFNALPEKVRQRFVACTRNADRPCAIHENVTTSKSKLRKGLLHLAAGTAVLYFLASINYGVTVDGRLWLAIYAGLASVAVSGLISVINGLVYRKALPYEPGIYLFPMHLVIAQGPRLRLIPTSELSNIGSNHHFDNGKYTGTSLRFEFQSGFHCSMRVSDMEKAQYIVDALDQYRQQLAVAAQNQQVEVFAGLDPFFEARASNEWDEMLRKNDPVDVRTGIRAGSIPALLRHARVSYLALGLVVGASVFYLRNVPADDRLFAQVEKHRTQRAIDDYHKAGGTRHRDEIMCYWQPLVALEEAKRRGSVTALRTFRDEYPRSVFDDDAKQAIHELFAKALEDLRAHAVGADPEVMLFMGMLFAYLEAHDSPPVEVRFHPPNQALLAYADEALTKMPRSETDGVVVSPISPSFTAERSEPRQTFIVRSLDDGFNAIVPNDILDLRRGPPISVENEDVSDIGEIRVPTIAVSYTVSPSGALYVNNENTHGYVGITVDFLVTMRIPGSDDSLDFPVTVQPPDRFTVTGVASNFFGVRTDSMPADATVYDVMARRAFENLATALGGAFFAGQPAGRGAGVE